MSKKLESMINTEFIKAMEWTPFNENQRIIDGGVYRMFNAENEIIYVGKSIELYVRIHNHLEFRNHTKYFMSEVVRVEWFQEKNPVFITLLESMLIAYYRPKYNDEVKDEKKLGADHENKKK